MSNVRLIRRRTAGVAATEFALVLPVMLLLTFAGADVARVLHVHTAVSNAARVGAEYGALHPFSPLEPETWELEVAAVVREELSLTGAVDADLLEIEINTTTDADGLYHVALEASYPFATVVGWPGLPSTIPLREYVEFRRLR
ncbi:TadE/TadG family type IV pilus assembly protein [Lignipirellula cremea]|uniref:TadE-like protein n=1 Tax=Lignipirellula cremea TaxID=2528010 RepID=A0A518DM70_9BACT|nr:TadE family protein [Lignipirellula cremea]QDU92934.1 TadE-like protein [Lignipirellula cremea]